MIYIQDHHREDRSCLVIFDAHHRVLTYSVCKIKTILMA